MARKSVEDILRKYGSELSKNVDGDFDSSNVSKEYSQFKEDMLPSTTRFEKMARSMGRVVKLKPSEKDSKKIQRELDSAHLDLSPSEVVSFAFVASFLLFFISLMVFLGVFFFQPSAAGAGIDSFFGFLTGAAGLFLFLAFVTSCFIFYFIYSSPSRLAKLWKLRAGSEMVPCILYVVVYMKHTSNLERAIGFASSNLNPPLSLDLKKIFWDVETGRFSTIKESLDNYLRTWEKDAVEFVEAFHLIESSLYEPNEARRLQTLEKALQVILDGVYENMLVFSRSIRSPLTNLYMLGIVLPTLALALLPLASVLLEDLIKWYHVFIIFNMIIPFFVFYMTNNIMLQRPGGYGETEILEMNPNYHKYKSKKPYVIAALVCLPLFVLGILPFVFQSVFILDNLNLQPDYTFASLGLSSLDEVYIFDFKDFDTGETITTREQLVSAKNGRVVGPFGVGALLLSLFIPLSVAMFFAISFRLRTKELIVSRRQTKQLEDEFTNSLFQLGNRIGDGIPAEIAFSKVSQSTQGLKTSEFFRIVNLNLQQGGMSLEKAIFDSNRGAIIYFPSQLIATSMRILLESVKKGLKIAAESLMSISEYIKNIQKVTRRLNDLLAEVVSDMKGNMVFLAPLLSGIVVGLTAMISFILNKLGIIFNQATQEGAQSISGFGDIGNILGIFQITNMVSPYFIQLAIGIYIIQIIFILTNVLTAIDAGDDRLKKTHDSGKNLGRGITLYVIITLISTIILSVLAGVALAGI